MPLLITPRDLLIPSDEPAVLEIEVERRYAPFVDPPAAGVRVEVEGHGETVTGADGLARVPLGILAPGTHALRVRVSGAPPARDVEAIVRSVPPDSTVFITDIDRTIADVSPAGFILLPNRWVRPLPGAREALTALAARMEIVYLSARDHGFLAKTRRWLKRSGFPEAPLYLRRGTRFWTVGSQEHKVARLGELRSRFRNIRAGVGDLPGDIHAYTSHGIPAVIISPRTYPGLPESTVRVTDWTAILEWVKTSDQ
ncbi:MAG TPA: hypothetical protein VEJ18_03235 [Planctomycetota bacterium]|nr:hypothetical protein [Planctomycetota bacterium]